MSQIPLPPKPTNTITSIPHVQSEASALIHMIERAARDPAIDLDKITTLLRERAIIKQEEAREAFAHALAEAQHEMRAVLVDKSNPSTKSKYASLAALDAEARPIYSKHGFAITSDTQRSELGENFIRVISVLMLGSHWKEYSIDMPCDGRGAKGGEVMTRTHATGSAVTYGRRYLLGLIFNLSTTETELDDDGNAASRKPAATAEPISELQVKILRELLTKNELDEEKFCQFKSLATLEDMDAQDFGKAMKQLESRLQREGKKDAAG
jgi:dsDNA-binding SOS-regulon protein